MAFQCSREVVGGEIPHVVDDAGIKLSRDDWAQWSETIRPLCAATPRCGAILRGGGSIGHAPSLRGPSLRGVI